MVEGQKQNIQFDIDILFYLYFTLDLRTTNSWIMTHESTESSSLKISQVH